MLSDAKHLGIAGEAPHRIESTALYEQTHAAKTAFFQHALNPFRDNDLRRMILIGCLLTLRHS
jgi:hypothetical protein